MMLREKINPDQKVLCKGVKVRMRVKSRYLSKVSWTTGNLQEQKMTLGVFAKAQNLQNFEINVFFHVQIMKIMKGNNHYKLS